MSYNATSVLKSALGASDYRAIFDDNNDGTDNDAGPQIVLDRAYQRIRRSLLVAFDGEPPFTEGTAPDSVKILELEYAILLSQARNPMYSRADAAKALASMDTTIDQVARSFTKVTADQPSPRPYLGAIADQTSPSGIEGASLAQRGAGETPPRFWYAERETNR